MGVSSTSPYLPSSPQTHSVPAASPNRRTRILLVEDNATIRHAFGILLEDQGYVVDQAASGEEALTKARACPPDLILMDLGLPDMNGLEVTRRLKADKLTRNSAIVALTGRALETDRTACLKAGCVGYLAKPINTEQLIRLIPTFLQNREKPEPSLE